MKRIKIIHKTEYNYSQPVTFGPHRLMMRPREGHDVHIAHARLDIEPAATVRWLRDIYSNSIAILTFTEPSQKLSIVGEVEVELRDDNPIECLIDPDARLFPFQYAPEEQIELIHYRLPSYPYEGPKLQRWLADLYRPGQTIGTFELLEKLNTQIFRSFAYAHRDDMGVQLPCDTLMRASGSCRDFAVFMMEAARLRVRQAIVARSWLGRHAFSANRSSLGRRSGYNAFVACDAAQESKRRDKRRLRSV